MGAAGKTLYVFNKTKQCFLCLNVSLADTPLSRMRGLLGRMRLRRDDGVWVMPSQGIHSIGMLFSIDVVYMDAQNRVIHVIEHFRPFRIAPLRVHAKSVLELPTRTISNSGTEVGDFLLICAPEELENYWKQDAHAEQRRSAVNERRVPVRMAVQMRHWWAKVHDKRKSPRSPGGALVAHYWTGGAPAPRKVTNVSAGGAYIQTPDTWSPGTVMTLTFQLSSTPSPNGAGGASENAGVASCEVCAVVVRSAADGFGVRFLFGNRHEQAEFQRFLRGSVPKQEPHLANHTAV
jgi:uncharacterized protein